MDRHTGELRERVTLLWEFESLIQAISSMFPLANHLALPGSESVFGISQGPPIGESTSLSKEVYG